MLALEPAPLLVALCLGRPGSWRTSSVVARARLVTAQVVTVRRLVLFVVAVVGETLAQVPHSGCFVPTGSLSFPLRLESSADRQTT